MSHIKKVDKFPGVFWWGILIRMDCIRRFTGSNQEVFWKKMFRKNWEIQDLGQCHVSVISARLATLLKTDAIANFFFWILPSFSVWWAVSCDSQVVYQNHLSNSAFVSKLTLKKTLQASLSPLQNRCTLIQRRI